MVPLNIAMISDFFLPIVGGVEVHIYSLAVELIKRGHKVIIITHSQGDRIGVRYLTPSLVKIYYLPLLPIASSATLPNFLTFLPYLRNILIREEIDLVHGHASLSSLAHEGMFHAPLVSMGSVKQRGGKQWKGAKTVFTDHSLFGFGDAVGILTNKLLAAALRNVDGVICVSHTGRENTALRAQLDPSVISVIPNALRPEQFCPDPSLADPSCITIVVVSRLVYRKGIDLLVASAPRICEMFPNVKFVVGGDGPKMVDLEQMRENKLLQDRIQILGSVKPSDVPNVLNRGQIYLSTSFTESFGISIIEAACAGLFIVSTKVGGVPEILPWDMIEFAMPNADDVVRALSNAIKHLQSGKHDPFVAHERLKDMYAWEDIAGRTEQVYERALAMEERDVFERMARLMDLGRFYGPIVCIIVAVQCMFLMVLDWWCPREEIDVVPALPGLGSGAVEELKDDGKKTTNLSAAGPVLGDLKDRTRAQFSQ